MEVTMFDLHVAFAAEVVAAVAAVFLVLSASTRTGYAKKLGNWVGSLALGIVSFSMLCTLYYGIAYWQQGIFSPKTVASAQSSHKMMGGMDTMHEHMHSMMEEGTQRRSTH